MTRPNATIVQLAEKLLQQVPCGLSAEDIANGAAFTFAGQSFELAMAPDAAVDTIAICADFGPPAAGKEAITLETILRTNTLLAGSYNPVYGMRAENKHVLLLQTLPVAGMSGDFLRQVLTFLAETGLAWRATEGFTQLAPVPHQPM
jgi:myo-inositol-hexaphosphate 3-phosphohydrolase